MTQDEAQAIRVRIMSSAAAAVGSFQSMVSQLAPRVTVPTLLSRTAALDRVLIAEHAHVVEELEKYGEGTTRWEDWKKERRRLDGLMGGRLGADEANRQRAAAEAMLTRTLCGDVPSLRRLAPIADAVSAEFAVAVQEALATVPV